MSLEFARRLGLDREYKEEFVLFAGHSAESRKYLISSIALPEEKAINCPTTFRY